MRFNFSTSVQKKEKNICARTSLNIYTRDLLQKNANLYVQYLYEITCAKIIYVEPLWTYRPNFSEDMNSCRLNWNLSLEVGII